MVDAARKGVGIRVGLEGEEAVKRGFNDIANSGRKMFAEIGMGAKSANPAIVALSRGSEEVGKSVAGMGAKLGPVGAGLSAFGVAGVGVTAVLAALVLAVNQAREAMAFSDELLDTANALNVSTNALQEWQFVLKKTGGTEEDAAAALEKFTRKFGEAKAQLSPDAAKPFAALGLDEKAIQGFANAEVALDAVMSRISNLSDAAEQAAIADKLGLTEMLPAIRLGAAAISDLRDEAHALGVVMDEELIRRGAEAQAEFETLSKVIDIQLKSAIIDLAPAIVSIIGLVADLATAFAAMADAWRDLDHKSTRGLKTELSELRAERERLGIKQLMGDKTVGIYGTPLEVAAKASAMTYGHTGDTGIPIGTAISDLDGRITDLTRRVGEREVAAAPRAPAGVGRLTPPRSGGGRSAGPKGLSAEEKAEGLRALELEHQLALARASGNDALVDRLETQRLIVAEAEKLVKLGKSETEALAEATAYAERLAISREIAEDKKRQDAAFQKSIWNPGGSPSLSEGLPTLVVGPDGQGWSPEQKDAWARSVGEATADGLDYALNGGDIGDWILQLFYRNALQGVSDAMTQAAASAEFNAGEGGGNWWSTALSWAGKLFGGQQQGRAAGGGMGQGYSFGEHGRAEIGMFSNGYVADHDATQRMLTEAVAQAGQASGARSDGARTINLNLTSVMQVPAGYTPPEGLERLMAQNRQQTIALIADKVGPLASAQQQQNFELKG